VRVLRLRIEPHGKTKQHAYSTDYAVVFLTDTAEHKAGDVVWETPTMQAEQNVSDKPFEAVIAEVKK
jgi:hypothetical protein